MWLDIVFAALILGLLVKTNLIEDRVKKLGSHAEGETERREHDACGEKGGVRCCSGSRRCC